MYVLIIKIILIIILILHKNLGHSATCYTRSLNKPGICIVTSGLGLTNLITPMLDAQNDHTSLIVFSSKVPLNVIGTQSFQEVLFIR